MVLLQTLDHLWREHLVTLEHLRQVIGFRAYGQRDPLNEYKSEAFVLFENMLGRLRENVTGQLMHVELAPPEEQPALQPVELPPMEAHHIDATTGFDELDPRTRDGRCRDVGCTCAPLRAAGTGKARADAGVARATATSIPRIPPRGAAFRATRCAHADQARSTSTATVKWTNRPPGTARIKAPVRNCEPGLLVANAFVSVTVFGGVARSVTCDAI